MLAHIIFVALVAVACSCSRGGDVENAVPSVYYWRTVFALDSAENRFLADHHVGRIYMRYFDVVVRDSVVKPNATIRFSQPVPQGIEVVPTVFVMENCLRHDMTGIADKLVDRILQMNETNDIMSVREVQVDCDWTARSQQQYFDFLARVRSLLKNHGMRLSATIRLHQLSMTPPPVDYGVLMMYNTGALTATNGHNPILDYRDAYPYLRNLRGYDLPLCAAWPAYRWNLLYSGNRFKAIMYDANLADTTLYREAAPGRYVVVSNRAMPEPNSDGSDITWVNVGDSVITVMPTADQIMNIVSATETERPGINKQVVMYSLDKTNIENYDKKFFETIFNR